MGVLMMSEPRKTLPVSETDKLFDEVYRKAFAEELTKQPERFDELSKALFTIELGSLSVYTLLLKFLIKQYITLFWPFVVITYVCWIIAMIWTLKGFMPKEYAVLGSQTQRGEVLSFEDKKLTIAEFYQAVTEHKKAKLFTAIKWFVAGLLCIFISLIVNI